ncbi:MAG: CHAD domain-containing protein [Cyanobacteria bacterium P01_D01_bin.105]
MTKVISSASAKKVDSSFSPEGTGSETAKNGQIENGQIKNGQTMSAVSQDLAQDKTRLGGYAYQIVRKQSQVIAKLRSPVLADNDPEDLHQMRIGTRRLAAAVLLFEDAISITSKKGKPKSAQELAKAIKGLTKVLGGVRDLDVMQQWFAHALANDKNAKFSKKETKIIKSLLKTIRKRRKKRFAKLKETLQRDRTKKLIAQFKKWTKQPIFTDAAQSSAAQAAALKIIEPIASLFRHGAWEMASRKRGRSTQLLPISDLTLEQLNQQLEQNGEQLHELRKQIKNVRYQTEFFRGLYDITYAAQVREFRTLQKILGGLQDQIVISQFLADEIGADWAKKLPTIAADFQNSRLALWQQWQPHQEKYLTLRSRLPNTESAA